MEGAALDWTELKWEWVLTVGFSFDSEDAGCWS